MTIAYIARTICIDPRLAEEALAGCQQGTFHAVPLQGRPRARLCLAKEPDADSLDPVQLFGRRGTLWVGLWPVQVHLECMKWSETKSELGLRPSRLRWPVGTEGYAREQWPSSKRLPRRSLLRVRSRDRSARCHLCGSRLAALSKPGSLFFRRHR